MKQHRALVFAIAGYAVLIILVFGKALVPPEGQMLFGDDIHRGYYFYREFFNYWMSRGIFPWWNPYLFGGEPFIANPIVNIWYPPNWIFSFLPLNIAYSWHIATHVFWACLGMYVFSKQLTKAKQEFSVAAFVSGVVFGLSGFFMARTFAGHVDVIAAASWMPWVVWVFGQLMSASVDNENFGSSPVWRAGLKPPVNRDNIRVQSGSEQNFIISFRRISIAAIIFAFQLLAGYQTMAFFTVIAVGIFAVFESLRQKNIRPLLLSFVALFISVCLAAVQILPTAELFSRSIRTFSFPYSWHSYGSLEWRSLLQFFNPFQFGNQYTYSGPPPNFIEHSAFVGVGGLVLVLFGVVRVFRELRGVGVAFFLIVFFGLWVSLGPNTPFDIQKLLWQFVPMYHYLRIPPRHLILVVFGLAGLAGIGMEYVCKSPKFLKAFRLPIMGIVVVEMVLFGRNFIELKQIPEMRHDTELIALLKSDAQPYRLLQNFGVWIPPRDSLDFDSVMAYAIPSATGYDPTILRGYYDYIALASGTTGERAALSHDVQVPYLTIAAADALDFLNVKYIMVPTIHDSFSGNTRYKSVREQKDYRVYENTTVKPRFYFLNDCGTANITSYTPNRVEIVVSSTCDDTLLSSEVWYPGWRAYIDDKKVDITISNGTFRTLFIPKGNHTIVYRYKPTIFFIGAGISIFTMILLGFWWNFSKKRTV